MFPIPSSPGHLDEEFLQPQALAQDLQFKVRGKRRCFSFVKPFKFKYNIHTAQVNDHKLHTLM